MSGQVRFTRKHNGFYHGKFVGDHTPANFHRAGGRPYLVLSPRKVLKAWGHDIDNATWAMNKESIQFKRMKVNTTEARYETGVLSDKTIAALIYNPTEAKLAMTPEARAEIDAHNKAAAERRHNIQLSQQQQRIADAVDRAGDVDPIDACVETVFYPNENSEHLDWGADTSDFPEYMDADSIQVTPPRTGGGAHGLKIFARDGLEVFTPWVRVNGIWCRCIPVLNKDRHWLVTDPEDLNEIREYGHDINGMDITMPNEPIPPRHKAGVLKLHYALANGIRRYGAPGLPRKLLEEWLDDVQIIKRALLAMSMAMGQYDVHAETRDLKSRGINKYEAMIRSRFGRRPPAYKKYDYNEWTNEMQGADPTISEWITRQNHHSRAMSEASNRADKYWDATHEARTKYNDALIRCKEREDTYAAIIRVLYPAG